jgi:transposase
MLPNKPVAGDVRRVAARHDRLAADYLAFVQLASIRLGWLARYESAPQSNSASA